MGSEMCIRDSLYTALKTMQETYTPLAEVRFTDYYSRVHTLYDGLRQMQQELPRRAAAGEDVEALVEEGVDAMTSPSVSDPGNVQQLAGWIQEETGGELFSIQVTDPYPSDWDACLERANEERGQDARPALVEPQVENLEQYDRVFLGYPNWWYGVPMALLTFLEENDLSGKDVLIVEDILDTGITLSNLVPMLKMRNPNSVKICTILDKPSRRKADIAPDYEGFAVPDEFVVGYGLDYDEKYRNLPYIGVLNPSVYEK